MGRKRHILVDTQGLLMHAIVHAADIQDRDGGAALMATLFGAFPFLTRLFADGGYRGSQFQAAIGRTLARVTVEIVKRSDQAKAFVVLPKRWIVERTLGRCRRLAKDWECLNRKALAFLRLASIQQYVLLRVPVIAGIALNLSPAQTDRSARYGELSQQPRRLHR